MPSIQSPETSAPTQVENQKLCFEPQEQQDISDNNTILLKNGATYTGCWEEGKANGKGKY